MAKQNMNYVGRVLGRENSIVEQPDEFFLNCVGKGWHPLVIEFLREVEKHDAVVVQVKEKFGGIRLYFNSLLGCPELDKKVNELENWSYKICENCGKSGELRKGSWWKTLCGECKGVEYTNV